MNKSLLNTWVSKERELKARLETLEAARHEGITDKLMESGIRLLIEEVITMRGEIEKDIEDVELCEIEKEIDKGDRREVA